MANILSKAKKVVQNAVTSVNNAAKKAGAQPASANMSVAPKPVGTVYPGNQSYSIKPTSGPLVNQPTNPNPSPNMSYAPKNVPNMSYAPANIPNMSIAPKVQSSSSSIVKKNSSSGGGNSSSSQPNSNTFVSNGVTYDSTGKAISQPKLKSTAQSTLLKQGTSGSNVSTVQSQLKNLGYNLTVDGEFGPQTKSQIMAFQEANGLTVDGIVGPQTLSALQTASGTTAKVGVMTTNSLSSPGTTPSTTSPSSTSTTLGYTPMSPQAEKAKFDAQANAEQDKFLNSAQETMGNSVEVSSSEKAIKALLDIATKNDIANKPKSQEEIMANKRRELAIDPLESRLAAIDARSAKLDAEREALFANEDNRQVSVMQINRRKSQEQIQYENEKRLIAVERTSIANELTQKYAVLDSFMKYSQMDYENATQAYNTQFTQAISMINLLKSVEEDKKSEKEKKEDKANASLKVMRDTLAGRSFSSLDAVTQASINKMDLEGGNPLGFSKFLMDNNIKGDRGSEFTDANGNRVVPIYSVDPKTGLMTAKILTLGKASGGDGSGNSSYIVKSGDDFNNLAQKFGTTIVAFRNANPNVDEFNMKIGQKINIPKYSATTAKTGMTDVELKQTINQAINTIPEDASDDDIKAYIRSLGGNPEDYGY